MSTHVGRQAASHLKVPRRWAKATRSIVAAFAIIVILFLMNPTNVAQTRPDHPDASLRTRRYRATLAHVAAITKIAIPRLRTYGRVWKLVEAKPHNDAFVLQAQVPVLVFTDDLEATLQEDRAQGEVMLDVRSASRVGRGDLGENRRHVIQLLRAVDAQLGTRKTGLEK